MISDRSMRNWGEREKRFGQAEAGFGKRAAGVQSAGEGRMRREREADEETEARLDELFRAYADACPAPEPSIHFMPRLWAGIEAREASRNVFGRMAKALVTAALAASAILAVLVSMNNDRTYAGTYIQALTAEHASQLEPFHLDRLSEMEQQ